MYHVCGVNFNILLEIQMQLDICHFHEMLLGEAHISYELINLILRYVPLNLAMGLNGVYHVIRLWNKQLLHISIN